MQCCSGPAVPGVSTAVVVSRVWLGPYSTAQEACDAEDGMRVGHCKGQVPLPLYGLFSPSETAYQIPVSDSLPGRRRGGTVAEIRQLPVARVKVPQTQQRGEGGLLVS